MGDTENNNEDDDDETFVNLSYNQTDSVHAASAKPKSPKWNKYKEKVFRKTILEKMEGITNVARSKYSLTKSSMNKMKIRDVIKESTPFVYPADVELQAYKMLIGKWRRDEVLKNRIAGSTFRSRNNEDLLARVYIEDNPNVGPQVRAIKDVDPGFHSLVDNRPVKDRYHRHRYIEDLRQNLRNRIEVGLINDEAILIQESCLLEKAALNECEKNLKIYSAAFETFLNEDHTIAITRLNEAEKQGEITNQLIAEGKVLSQEIGIIRGDLLTLEDVWQELKKYQAFLFRIAPLPWRFENDWVHRDSEGNLLQDRDDHKKLEASESVATLQDVLNDFTELVEHSPPPVLPFSDPQEVLVILDDLADSTLHSLAHLESIASPLAAAKAGAKLAREQMESELNLMRENIETAKVAIMWEEQRGNTLMERGQQLLKGALKDCMDIGPPLATLVWVEDCYETCVGPNDSNLSAIKMARGIESEMHSLGLELDAVTVSCAQAAERQVKAEQEKLMITAKEAAVKIKSVNALVKTVQRGLEPVRPYGRRRLKPRTPPPLPIPRPITPPRVLTEEEILILTFFTQFCPGDDIEQYLSVCESAKKKPTPQARHLDYFDFR